MYCDIEVRKIFFRECLDVYRKLFLVYKKVLPHSLKLVILGLIENLRIQTEWYVIWKAFIKEYKLCCLCVPLFNIVDYRIWRIFQLWKAAMWRGCDKGTWKCLKHGLNKFLFTQSKVGNSNIVLSSQTEWYFFLRQCKIQQWLSF